MNEVRFFRYEISTLPATEVRLPKPRKELITVFCSMLRSPSTEARLSKPSSEIKALVLLKKPLLYEKRIGSMEKIKGSIQTNWFCERNLGSLQSHS